MSGIKKMVFPFGLFGKMSKVCEKFKTYLM
jgi:hypothetical protein